MEKKASTDKLRITVNGDFTSQGVEGSVLLEGEVSSDVLGMLTGIRRYKDVHGWIALPTSGLSACLSDSSVEPRVRACEIFKRLQALGRIMELLGFSADDSLSVDDAVDRVRELVKQAEGKDAQST